MKLQRLTKFLTVAALPVLMVALVASMVFATKASAACPGSCQWPSAGRDFFHGYLTDTNPAGPSSNRGAVWPSNSGLMQINNAEQFISWMQPYLFDTSNGSVNRGTGAATYVVTSMLGYKGPDFNNDFLQGVNTARSRWSDWQALIRLYHANGWVNWNVTQVNCTPYVQANMHYPSNDIFFFTAGAGQPVSCESELEIVFTNPNGSHYRLKKICGNPVGETEPLEVDAFNITGRTTVSDASVLPGESTTFRHYLRNDSTSGRSIDWTTRNGLNDAQLAQGNNEIVAPNSEKLVNIETITVPAGAAPGTQYCRYVRFSPVTQGGGTGQGTTVCAVVAVDFSLQPTVIASSTTAGQGDSITFTYTVRNNGLTQSQPLTNCKVVGNTHTGGYTPQPQENEDRTSDPGYSAPAAVCALPFQPNTTVTVVTETLTIGNESPGGMLCRSLVVDPRDPGGGPRASAEACVVIAKSPYVHFMGNDVWAGGGFIGDPCDNPAKIVTSARTLSDGSVAGGAVEYGAFALDRISNFGSANKALINPAGAAGKILTFSNLDSANLGFYGAAQHCIDDYLSRFTDRTAESSTNINVGGRGNGVWSVAGGTVFAGDMPAGSQQVYAVNGDAVIAGNLRYPANFNGLTEVPSLIIIATGNITVQSGVSQVDGIFVAKNNFRTCDPPPGNLSTSICNVQLTINGVVIANKLELLRTFGAEGSNPADQKRPAEVFVFRPEIYLRSALSGGNGITIRTVEQRDAPPRY